MRDGEFIRNLYETTSVRLMKYIMHLCNDRHLSEDVLQETYFEALLRKSTLIKHENVTGWLYKTASYKLMNARRRREMQNVSINALLGDNREPKGYDVSFINCECWMTLEATLSKSERQLVWLHYIHGYTWKEISLTEGISEGALRTQMFRIKKKLRKMLGKEFKL